MTFCGAFTIVLKAALITLSVLAIIIISDDLKTKKEYKEKNWKYEEVYRINDVHSATLNAVGIEETFYYNWEETAHSLDVPVDSLTINMYLKHILHGTD